MDKFKKEFVRAIMISLKIDDNPFIIATIDEFTAQIQPTQFKQFLTALFGEQHQYLNGIDRVAKVAEQFKPQESNKSKSQAQHLILAVEQMNTYLWYEAQDLKRVFEDYVKDYEFDNVKAETKAILNNVAPYYDIASLVINIRSYQTSVDALSAFKQALKQIDSGSLVIESGRVQQMIGGK